MRDIQEREHFEADQEKFKLAAQALLPLDLSKFIRTMDHAEAIGPFFAPTAWQAKHKDLAIDIAAAKTIQECAEKLRDIYKDAPAMKALQMVKEAMAVGEEPA